MIEFTPHWQRWLINAFVRAGIVTNDVVSRARNISLSQRADSWPIVTIELVLTPDDLDRLSRAQATTSDGSLDTDDPSMNADQQ